MALDRPRDGTRTVRYSPGSVGGSGASHSAAGSCSANRQRLADSWNSMTVTLSDQYVDFFTLGQGVLRMLADIYRVDVTDDDMSRINTAMRTMPAHPDAVEALTQLHDNGFRLVTLTNSPHLPGHPTPLESAGLAGLFERQLSVDSCRAFKPAAAVYRHVCQELDAAPSECMMVAAHVWDLLGACNVGLRSALIARPGNPPLQVQGLPQPDLVVSNLHELVQRLDAMGSVDARLIQGARVTSSTEPSRKDR